MWARRAVRLSEMETVRKPGNARDVTFSKNLRSESKWGEVGSASCREEVSETLGCWASQSPKANSLGSGRLDLASC